MVKTNLSYFCRHRQLAQTPPNNIIWVRIFLPYFQLRLTQRLGLAHSIFQMDVEALYQQRGGLVLHVPQAGDDTGRSGEEKVRVNLTISSPAVMHWPVCTLIVRIGLGVTCLGLVEVPDMIQARSYHGLVAPFTGNNQRLLVASNAL